MVRPVGGLQGISRVFFTFFFSQGLPAYLQGRFELRSIHFCDPKTTRDPEIANGVPEIAKPLWAEQSCYTLCIVYIILISNTIMSLKYIINLLITHP